MVTDTPMTAFFILAEERRKCVTFPASMAVRSFQGSIQFQGSCWRRWKAKEKKTKKINRKKENHKIKVADEMRRVTTTNIVRVDETEKEVIKRFLIEIPCLRYTKKFRGSFKNTFYLSLMIENVSHIFTLVFLRRENEVKLWLWRNFGGNVIWISQKNILELITGWKLWMMVDIITRVHHHKKLKLTRQYFTLEQFYVWVILIQIFNQRLLFFITKDYYFCRCKKINCC